MGRNMFRYTIEFFVVVPVVLAGLNPTTSLAESGTSDERCYAELDCLGGKTTKCDLYAHPDGKRKCAWRVVEHAFIQCTGWDKDGNPVTIRERCKRRNEMNKDEVEKLKGDMKRRLREQRLKESQGSG